MSYFHLYIQLPLGLKINVIRYHANLIHKHTAETSISNRNQFLWLSSSETLPPVGQIPPTPTSTLPCVRLWPKGGGPLTVGWERGGWPPSAPPSRCGRAAPASAGSRRGSSFASGHRRPCSSCPWPGRLGQRSPCLRWARKGEAEWGSTNATGTPSAPQRQWSV